MDSLYTNDPGNQLVIIKVETLRDMSIWEFPDIEHPSMEGIETRKEIDSSSETEYCSPVDTEFASQAEADFIPTTERYLDIYKVN